MRKKKSKKRIIILIVVVVIVLLGLLGYIRLRSNLTALTKTTYDIVDVEKGTIEVKVKGAGAVEPLEDHTVYASFTGTVQSVMVENGDSVSAGDTIVTLTSDELETEIDTLEQEIEDIDTAISALKSTAGSEYIVSPVKGTVKVMYAGDGDAVDVVMNQYGALAVVCPDGLMQAVVPYSGDVSLGQAVTVTIDMESVEGTVYRIDAQAGEAVVQFEDDGFAVGSTVVVTDGDSAELGAGVITVANPVYITGKGGVIDKIYEDTGDDVSRGGKLFHLDGDILSGELYSQIEQRKDLEEDLKDALADMEQMVVTAPVDGVISGMEMNAEQMIQQGAALFTIESDQQVTIDVEIDELDIVNIAPGQTAEVTFDALEDQTYTATVAKINPVGISENNVTNYTVTLELEETDGVLLGMSADVEILSQTAEDVLLIPIEAIQVIDGEKYVVFESDIDEDLSYTPATHKIETGITDGVNIEVTSGLSEGDRVAVPEVQEASLEEQMWSYRSNSTSTQTDAE